MKRLLLFILCFLGAAVSAYAQGALITIDNNQNSDPSPTATSYGLVFLPRDGHIAPIQQDVNIALYGGTDSTSLSLIGTFYGPAAIGDNAAGPGTFTDLSGT